MNVGRWNRPRMIDSRKLRNMNRLLSILVTLFILFLVYLWINHLTQDSGVQPETKETPVEVIPPVDDPETENPVTTPPTDNTSFEETPSEPVQVKEKEQDAKAKEKVITQPKETQPTPTTPAPKETRVQPQSKPAAGSSDASGMHLVIAGNFLTRANAEERVRQLQKLGYSKAEVVNFELSEYHTACAGRYSDLNEARKVSRKIKEMHNIDTYVRLGN